MLILEQCQDLPTRMAFTATHRLLRTYGAPLALRLQESAIVLGSSVAITSFLAFLTCSLGDQVQRARQLQAVRALDITLSPCDPATAVQLAAAIHHMRNIEALTLRNPEEALATPGVMGLLTQVTTLKALHAFGAGPRTHTLFRDIRSRLEDATVVPRADAVREEDSVNLPVVLGRHRDTLTCVSATRALILADEDVVFSGVHQLSVCAPVHDAEDDFVRAFPNITALELGTSWTSWSARLRGIRRINKVQTMAAQEEGTEWILQSVRGGLFDLYAMGNHCIADTLDITGPVRDHAHCIPRVVGDYLPKILRVAISSSLHATELYHRDLQRLLTSVTYVALTVVVEDINIDIMEQLVVSTLPSSHGKAGLTNGFI